MSIRNFFEKSPAFWRKRKENELNDIKFNFIAAAVCLLVAIALWFYNFLLALIAAYFCMQFFVSAILTLPMYLEANHHASKENDS